MRTAEERRRYEEGYAATDAKLAASAAQSSMTVSAPDGPVTGDEAVEALIADRQRTADAQAALAQAEVIRPDQMDSLDREISYRRQFAHAVGRLPDVRELRGAAVADCAGCERMSGTGPCDDHARKLGEPIAAPPRPWPSESPGHYPGAIHLPPYNIDNSVK